MVAPPKCATTWMHLCLGEHPDVYLPFKKELHFFDREYHLGLKWYERYFIARKKERAAGEVSTGYLRHPEAASRIIKDLGRIRIITCLRDPVTRAYSRYKHLYRKGAITVEFGQALQSVPELIGDGRYYDHLKRYVDTIGKENILTLIFERFQKDPLADLVRVYRFLGVNDAFIPKAASQRIVTEEWNTPIYAAYANTSAALRRYPLMAALIDAIKKTPVLPVVDGIFKRSGYAPTRRKLAKTEDVPPVKPTDIEYIWGELGDQVEGVEKIFQMDLGFWRPKRR